MDLSDDAHFSFGNLDLEDARREQQEAFRNGSMSSFAVDPVWPSDYPHIFPQPPSAALCDNAEFLLYQSRESLATSTTSALSGFPGAPTQRAFLDLNDLTRQFREDHAMVDTPLDGSGHLNIETFKMGHPVVATMMDAFVTVACNLLYCLSILPDWPTSEVLDGLSKMAIQLILGARHVDHVIAAEVMSFSVLNALEKWVSGEVRNHLEEVLDVARTFMSGFGLSDENSTELNKANFRAAATRSTYLHLHYIPQSPGETRRILFAYMNPVLLQVIRQAFYTSTTSITRKMHKLFKEYPSLQNNPFVKGDSWKSAVPPNAFSLGVVATRQALKEWQWGIYAKLTWSSSARSRFGRIQTAILEKTCSRAYFDRLCQDAGTKWYNELHLADVDDGQTGRGSDTDSDADSVYDIPK